MVSARQTDVEQRKVYQLSIYGKALYDRTYKTAKVGGMFICYVWCERDPVCKGLNFKNTKDICEMNILTTGIVTNYAKRRVKLRIERAKFQNKYTKTKTKNRNKTKTLTKA